MDRAALILSTLETVAESVGDPNDKIYAKLFADHPEFLDLFVMDKDGGVRANMLTTSFDCIIGIAEGSSTPRLLLEAAHIEHDGYGLSSGDIDLLFIAMRDVVRETLADDWTTEIDAAWTSILEDLAEIGRTIDTD